MSAETLVLGIGNILCGDEGIGCRVAEYLYMTREFTPAPVIADGGTMGQELFGPVTGASNLLVIDCADFGQEPGQCVFRADTDLPMWLGTRKMSAHQGAFAEILALASLRNSLPERMALLGIQPLNLEFGAGLSPLLLERIPDYADRAELILKDWGHAAKKRITRIYLSDTAVALQNMEHFSF